MLFSRQGALFLTNFFCRHNTLSKDAVSSQPYLQNFEKISNEISMQFQKRGFKKACVFGSSSAVKLIKLCCDVRRQHCHSMEYLLDKFTIKKATEKGNFLFLLY